MWVNVYCILSFFFIKKKCQKIIKSPQKNCVKKSLNHLKKKLRVPHTPKCLGAVVLDTLIVHLAKEDCRPRLKHDSGSCVSHPYRCINYVYTTYQYELGLSMGFTNSPQSACRHFARWSARAQDICSGMVKARTSRCKARTHKGPAQAHSQARGLSQDQPALKHANRCSVRAYRCKARAHKGGNAM